MPVPGLSIVNPRHPSYTFVPWVPGWNKLNLRLTPGTNCQHHLAIFQDLDRAGRFFLDTDGVARVAGRKYVVVIAGVDMSEDTDQSRLDTFFRGGRWGPDSHGVSNVVM